jgi:hypothetical protein
MVYVSFAVVRREEKEKLSLDAVRPSPVPIRPPASVCPCDIAY